MSVVRQVCRPRWVTVLSQRVVPAWSLQQVPKQFGRQAERKLDERTNPDSSLNRSIRAAKTIERMLNQNTSDDIAKGNGQLHLSLRFIGPLFANYVHLAAGGLEERRRLPKGSGQGRRITLPKVQGAEGAD